MTQPEHWIEIPVDEHDVELRRASTAAVEAPGDPSADDDGITGRVSDPLIRFSARKEWL